MTCYVHHMRKFYLVAIAILFGFTTTIHATGMTTEPVEDTEEPVSHTDTEQTMEVEEPSAKTSEEYLTDLGSGNPDLQIAAARALGENKEARAIDPLIGLLIYSDDYEVAYEAALALGKIGKTGETTDALLTSLRQVDNDVVRYASVAALLNIKDKDKNDEIIAALTEVTNTTDDELLRDLAEKVAELKR